MDDDLIPYTPHQQREHDERQQDPKFLQWLADATIELEQLRLHDVPDLARLDDPWGREGVQVITHAALRAFTSDTLPTLDDEQQALLARMARGLGHIFVLACGGQWVFESLLVIRGKSQPPVPLVQIGGAMAWSNPVGLLVFAVTDRSDTIVLDAFDHAVADSATWAHSGTDRTSSHM